MIDDVSFQRRRIVSFIPHVCSRHFLPHCPSSLNVFIAWGLLVCASVFPTTRGIAEENHWFHAPDLQKRLKGLGLSEARPGKLRIYENGHSLRRKIERIRSAKLGVLQAYEWLDDPTGRSVAQALMHSVAHGGRWLVMFDEKCNSYPGSIPHSWSKRFENAGIHLIRSAPVKGWRSFNPLVPLMRPYLVRDHQKVLITVDQNGDVESQLGGQNLTDQSTGGLHLRRRRQRMGERPFRDTDVVVKGPAAREVLDRVAFSAKTHLGRSADPRLAILDELRGAMDRQSFDESSPEASSVRIIGNDPLNRRYTIEDTLVELLDATPAGETVRNASACFSPTRKLLHAIQRAMKRNVRFEGLYNATTVTDPSIRFVATGAHVLYRETMSLLRRDALDVHLANPGNRFSAVHHKYWLFGKKGPAIITSSNTDRASLRWNYEIAALVEGTDVVDYLHTMFDRDLATLNVSRLSASDVTVPWSSARRWARERLYLMVHNLL